MPTVEERLASLEARVDAMADVRNLITELRGDMNRQFTELRENVNRRFEIIDVKFDRHFVWLMGMMVTGFITVIGALARVVYR